MAAASHITTTTPALKARAAGLRERLARHLPPPSQARTDLLTAYVEAQDAYPICEREDVGTPRYTAAVAADRRLCRSLSEILGAPTPNTLDGLRTLALAAAISAEGAVRGSPLDNGRELVATARALLVATDTALPAEFLVFGDEPDFEARERMLLAKPGRLPEWAQVEVVAAA